MRRICEGVLKNLNVRFICLNERFFNHQAVWNPFKNLYGYKSAHTPASHFENFRNFQPTHSMLTIFCVKLKFIYSRREKKKINRYSKVNRTSLSYRKFLQSLCVPTLKFGPYDLFSFFFPIFRKFSMWLQLLIKFFRSATKVKLICISVLNAKVWKMSVKKSCDWKSEM